MAESPQTYSLAFLAAIGGVLNAEGGYVAAAAGDPGGETNFGISKRSYPKLDIRNLTRDQAIAIYFADYWQKFSLDDLPPEVAEKVFNIGVDIYLPPAIVCLQRACRACGHDISESGSIDAETKFAVEELAEFQKGSIMAALRSELAAHYRLVAANQGVRTQTFLRGWLTRAYS